MDTRSRSWVSADGMGMIIIISILIREHPLELVYESHVSRVKEEVSQLQQRLRELSAHVEKVELNVRIVRDTKEERVKEIRNAVDLMIGRLDAQLKVWTLIESLEIH